MRLDWQWQIGHHSEFKPSRTQHLTSVKSVRKQGGLFSAKLTRHLQKPDLNIPSPCLLAGVDNCVITDCISSVSTVFCKIQDLKPGIVILKAFQFRCAKNVQYWSLKAYNIQWVVHRLEVILVDEVGPVLSVNALLILMSVDHRIGSFLYY